jgi:hypothetical protein
MTEPPPDDTLRGTPLAIRASPWCGHTEDQSDQKAEGSAAERGAAPGVSDPGSKTKWNRLRRMRRTVRWRGGGELPSGSGTCPSTWQSAWHTLRPASSSWARVGVPPPGELKRSRGFDGRRGRGRKPEPFSWPPVGRGRYNSPALAPRRVHPGGTHEALP